MASYNPPNPYVPGAFNPNQYIAPSANITAQYLSENYLQFPFAQGAENFVSINNQGQLNQGGKAEFSSATIPVNFLITPTITNPFTFPDTTHTSSLATIGYVNNASGGGGDLLPANNPWTGLNTFNPTPISGDITYPTGLNLANGVLSANDIDLVCITPNNTLNAFNIFTQSSGALTSSSVPSIQIANNLGSINLNATATGAAIGLHPQTQVNITNSTNNASLVVNSNITANNGYISSSTYRVGGSTNTLTGGASSITSSVNFTSPSFIINDGVDNNYQFYSQNAYGLVIANTSGGLGTLSLSNGGASVSTITCTSANTLDFNGASIALNGIGCQAISCSTLNSNGNLITCGSLSSTGAISGSQLTLISGANSTALTTTSTGLTCNDSITIPAQTYPLASSNIASTISYVNQAIASQGSGDVTQSGNNAFTGTNSFSQVPTTSVTQTAFNTTSTQLASIGYITSFVYNNTQSVPLTSTILIQGGAYYTYNNSYYQTGVIGKSVFSLSTSGRATFSFSAQSNPQNAYGNNNAYLQLLSPTWGGSPTNNAESISNGAQNPILLGIWNSIQSIAKFSFPFNPTTLSQLNQYGQTFVSNVLYYPNNTQYSQVYRAYVSVFTANDNSQNVALYVYPPFNGIGAQLAVQICPFTFSFG
jgi:hypothetical protein